MYAIIIAAGPTYRNYGFPIESKPKPLFHVNGETLLERQVRLLKTFGIRKIRVVVGYQKEKIEHLNRKVGLGLEVVFNSDWKIDSLNSLIVGVKGIDDDVLIIFGDVYLTTASLNEVLENKHPLVMLLHGKNSGYDLFSIKKANLPLIKQIKKFGTAHQSSQGIRLTQSLRRICETNGAVAVTPHGTMDVDYYRQTDEYHQSVRPYRRCYYWIIRHLRRFMRKLVKIVLRAH